MFTQINELPNSFASINSCLSLFLNQRIIKPLRCAKSASKTHNLESKPHSPEAQGQLLRADQ